MMSHAMRKHIFLHILSGSVKGNKQYAALFVNITGLLFKYCCQKNIQCVPFRLLSFVNIPRFKV